jgi:hypothetical protein
MKRLLFALAGVGLWVGTGHFAAQAIESDPSKNYDVTREVGAWMICAASYTGPTAAQQAHELVMEIRTKYQLPAYVYNRGAEERRKQQEQIDRIRKLCPEGKVRIERIEEGYAVLVGGYKDMDSAHSALDGFKKLEPSKKLMPFFDTAKEATQNGQKGVLYQRAYLNPFLSSFVVRNPVVPVEQQRNDNVDDPFLRKINAGETYNIYRCGKPWTLAVAVFQGAAVLEHPADSSFLQKLMGQAGGEQLAASALNAHNLAEALKKLDPKLGLKDVYVFHTRYYSVVSIGGFESANDPRMAQTQVVLKKCLHPDVQVKLLAQPLPMPVPH